MSDDHRLPRGRQPYDTFNGARVGAVAGALLGALATVLTTASLAWLILVGGAVGAVAGYAYERRRIAVERGRSDDPD